VIPDVHASAWYARLATGTTAIDLPRRLAPMTLEFVYTALLVVMLAASGVFGLYVIYRLLRG
jgi:hypothetical protein